MSVAYTVTLHVSVIDRKRLFAAAHERALEDGVEEGAEMLEVLPPDDVTAALIVLLDPGQLAGCEIETSYCERDEAQYGLTPDEEKHDGSVSTGVH